MGPAAVPLMIASTAFSAAGTLASVKAARDEAKTQEAIALTNAEQARLDSVTNAQIARANSQQMVMEGESEVETMRIKSRIRDAAFSAQQLRVGALGLSSTKSMLMAEALTDLEVGQTRYGVSKGVQQNEATRREILRQGDRALALGSFEASVARARGKNKALGLGLSGLSQTLGMAGQTAGMM